jgi:hypothetical protein
MRTKQLNPALLLLAALLFTFSLFVIACGKQESSEQTAAQQTQQPAAEAPAATTPETQAPQAAAEQTQPAAEPDKAAQPETKEPAGQTAMAAAEAKLVPLDIKLPKPMFIGTPQNIQVPNLEKPLGKPRPPFLAPEGTVNAASGKSVASSDEAPVIGEIKMITDGDKEAGDGSYVELGPFLQHVTIDLGKPQNIYALVLWHYHKQPRVYYDVIIQVANDPNFSKEVSTLYNNDLDNSAKLGVGKDMHYTETAEGRLIDGKGVVGRYVRLYSNGNTSDDLNHYIEVEVYGKPAAAI